MLFDYNILCDKGEDNMTEEEWLWYQDEHERLEKEYFESCPYFIAYNGGPQDLPGAYGPGTCAGGCWTEPICVTG